MGELNLLTEDLLINILMRLPIKYILRLRSVCKNWNFVLQSIHFGSLHNKHKLCRQERLANDGVSSFIVMKYFKPWTLYGMLSKEPGHVILSFITVEKKNNELCATTDRVEKFDIPFIKSMNKVLGNISLSNVYGGIICLENLNGVILYNPYTREFEMLPFHPLTSLSTCQLCYDLSSRYTNCIPECHHTTLGIWFDSNQPRTIKHYKVFSVFNMLTHSNDPLTKRHTYVIEKYDSIDGAWKQIKTVPNKLCSFDNNSSGLLLNEIFHLYIDADFIITLEARSETFGLLPLPSEFLNWHSSYELFVFGGSLAMLVDNHDREVCTDVWLMTEYGVKKSWTKQYTILNEYIPLNEYITLPDLYYINPYDFSLKQLAVWKCMHDDEILFEITMYEEDEYGEYVKRLVSFNPLSNKLTKIDHVADVLEPEINWIG